MTENDLAGVFPPAGRLRIAAVDLALTGARVLVVACRQAEEPLDRAMVRPS